MIYSVNFFDMTENLNPLAVCKYLDRTGWSLFPIKRTDIKVYQYRKKDVFEQVTVPLEKSLSDYKRSMYDAAERIAIIEGEPLERIMLYLLNPNADILKIRLHRKEVESGNILFDDAINLYDNAKKLLAATALDVINPKKIHYGRLDDSVLKFLSQCRFGQTEIGSYIVSLVCPFAEWSDTKGYHLLSIFSEEEECANSLTRRITNRLMTNLATVKECVDRGKTDSLSAEESNISTNFLEALNNLNPDAENTLVEFTAEWSPVVKKNRCDYSKVRMTNDYHQPISSVIDKIKGITSERTEIIGKIRSLTAAPSIDKRDNGTVTVVYIADNNRAKSVNLNLSREDYENAVNAHQQGKAVRIIGDFIGNQAARMENVIFNVIE